MNQSFNSLDNPRGSKDSTDTTRASIPLDMAPSFHRGASDHSSQHSSQLSNSRGFVNVPGRPPLFSPQSSQSYSSSASSFVPSASSFVPSSSPHAPAPHYAPSQGPSFNPNHTGFQPHGPFFPPFSPQRAGYPVSNPAKDRPPSQKRILSLTKAGPSPLALSSNAHTSSLQRIHSAPIAGSREQETLDSQSGAAAAPSDVVRLKSLPSKPYLHEYPNSGSPELVSPPSPMLNEAALGPLPQAAIEQRGNDDPEPSMQECVSICSSTPTKSIYPSMSSTHAASSASRRQLFSNTSLPPNKPLPALPPAVLPANDTSSM